MSHIIGKVYDVTAENMNKLIKEIEALQQENAALQQMPSGVALQALSEMSQSETEDVEYWVEFDKVACREFVYTEKVDGLDEDAIHVISYSAYSALKAECKRLKTELDEMTLRFQALQSGFEFEIDKRNLENADLVAENEQLKANYTQMKQWLENQAELHKAYKTNYELQCIIESLHATNAELRAALEEMYSKYSKMT